MGAEREALEALLGHRFNNGHLLSRALTHKSCLYERNADGEHEVVLDGGTRLRLSRTYREELQKRLGR